MMDPVMFARIVEVLTAKAELLGDPSAWGDQYVRAVVSSVVADTMLLYDGTLKLDALEPAVKRAHQLPTRNGARMSCGCWWDAPAGAERNRTITTCPFHGNGVYVLEVNVEEPANLYRDRRAWIPDPGGF